MPTDDGKMPEAAWPLPKFFFVVDLGPGLNEVPFQEVSGLDTEPQIVEYRHSDSQSFSTIKMPGIAKYDNVTLKRGIIVNSNSFWAWHTKIKMNTISRGSVVIKLLDEAGQVTMQWQLTKAWPTKILANDLNAEGDEVAIDTLEIAHEGIIITNNG